jgi:hypothetical protein
MAEGAIEIEEDVRKRNEKIIDSTMEANANRRAEEMSARKEKEREYKLLAKRLSSLEGMDSNKVNLVLSYGTEEASNFIENAPEIAAKKNISVADLIELQDPSAQSIDPSTFISQGELIDMPQFTPYARPAGLRESPIFRRDYDAEYDATSSDFYEGLGLPASDADIDVTYSAPEGRILYEDMFSTTRGEIPKLSPNQARNVMGEMIADRLGVGATYDDNNNIQLDSDDKELARQARSLLNTSYNVYNQSLRDEMFDVDFNQDLAINYAVGNVLQNTDTLPTPTPTATNTGTSTTTTTTPPPSDPYANLTSPAALATEIRRREGLSVADANKKAREILNQRKADAQ